MVFVPDENRFSLLVHDSVAEKRTMKDFRKNNSCRLNPEDLIVNSNLRNRANNEGLLAEKVCDEDAVDLSEIAWVVENFLGRLLLWLQ